jgi:hypothetical protein
MNDYKEGEKTPTEKAKIKKGLYWIIESMRYEDKPKITINEIGERICQIITASNKFTKKRKELEELYDEYRSSEAEGYGTDSSFENKDNEEWYKEYEKTIAEHYKDCRYGKESKKMD